MGNEAWSRGEERLYRYEIRFLPIKTGDRQGEVHRFLASTRLPPSW